MAYKIEMSLDDIIKANGSQMKKSIPVRSEDYGTGSDAGRKHAKSYATGAVLKNRRGELVQKPYIYNVPKRIAVPTSLFVCNLDYAVTDADIKNLFKEFGPMRKASIHYNSYGRSLGTAVVIFERRCDALEAIKKYHGVTLDGRPMNIRLAFDDHSQLVTDSKGRSGAVPTSLKRGGRGGLKRLGGKPKAATFREQKVASDAEEFDAELDY